MTKTTKDATFMVIWTMLLITVARTVSNSDHSYNDWR
jgi:hypothetical protein